MHLASCLVQIYSELGNNYLFLCDYCLSHQSNSSAIEINKIEKNWEAGPSIPFSSEVEVYAISTQLAGSE